MSASQIYLINVKPGVKRDGTQFEGDYYTDAEWCRFYRGKPKKIGGYKNIYNQYEEIIRGQALNIPDGQYNYIYAGSETQFQMLQITSDGTPSGIADRTPSGFVDDTNNEWKITSIFNSSGSDMAIVAMATHTLCNIAETTDCPIYYGIHTASTALTDLGFSVSGGIVALPPYLFAYGTDGYIAWSDKNDITNIGGAGTGDAGEARICTTKVVHGIPIRGGSSNSPSGLFWSLETLQRVSFVGGDTVFSNDTISSDISILSTNAVVDYGGVIYWPAIDRWLMYNGTVQEIPNNMNLDFFFNNYNKTCPQKIFSFKVPRWGEIWTCFPFGNSTECNWAIIQNVREGTWYDTPLPEDGRSAAISPKTTFPYPLMFGITQNDSGRYVLWQHEFGVDKTLNAQALAIRSSFETCNVAYMAEGPFSQGWQGKNKWVRVIRIEPDFVLSGSLVFTLLGKQFAMDTDNTPKSYTFDNDSGNGEVKIDSRKQYRQLRLKVTSNEEGGDYYAGNSVWELAEGDVRATTGSAR
jgi:hypothetical protein